MKSWKKQLKDEFDALTPSLRDDILNAPINVGNEATSTHQGGGVLARRRVGISVIALILVVAIVAVSLYCIFGIFIPTSNDCFFAVEINPGISIVTDKNGKVKSVSSINNDADIILSDERTLQQMIGSSLSEAIVIYTDSAARLGYLDISKKGDAVRISSLDKKAEKIGSGAAEALENYFCEKGIYALVVSEAVGVKELANRVGIKDTNNIVEFSKEVNSLSSLAFERVGNDYDEFSVMYETYVLGSQMFEIVREKVLESIESVKKNFLMTSEMAELYLQILLDEDNPSKGLLSRDYWELKKKYVLEDYTPEFAKLIVRMDNLIDDYEREFGKRIGSHVEILALVEVYETLSGSIEDIINGMTSENFVKTADKFISILKNIGIDVSSLEPLISLPNTIEEYYNKSKLMIGELFSLRIERYSDIYESYRAKIVKEDYESYKREIELNYGSLSEYWNTIK